MDFNFDPTITTSILIALIALISPIVIAIINNIHESEIKKLDMYEAAKRGALSNFIDSAEAAILNYEDEEAMLEYAANSDKLFIYFSNFSLELILPFETARAEVNRNNTAENFRKANRELSKLISKLSEEIKKK